MPEPLSDALAQLRELLLSPALVRAVASGRRHGRHPAHLRAELRPVLVKAGSRLQVVSTDGRHPITRNLEAVEAVQAVDVLLAEPFGGWFVQTADVVWQLRVTKRGEAQVHRAPSPARPSPPPRTVSSGHDRVKVRLLPDADPIFAALGASADKRRQVESFLRLLAPAVGPALVAAQQQDRPLRVVDLGCGNAYLTFAAHRWLAGLHPQVQTIGVDTRADSIARNTRIAANLDLTGLSFATGSIDQAPLEGADLVLALHACDTATDQALARAVRWSAPVLLAAPCCHHDLHRQLTAGWSDGGRPPPPFGALARDGILRERFADVLTDLLRAALLRLLGYRVEVVEFVESRHTPRNAMIRAVRTGAKPDPRRRSEYADLAALWGVRPKLAELVADLVAERLVPAHGAAPEGAE